MSTLERLNAVPWTLVGMALLFVSGVLVGLVRGAGVRVTLYQMFKDPFADHVSTVTVMVFGTWLAIVGAFSVAVRTKPDLLDTTMLTLAGATLMLTGSAAGNKWLASRSGVRVDQGDPPAPSKQP